MVKVSGGAFDGPSATGKNEVLGAGRVQIDFWDPEGGYYLNGTYYGDKKLLAVGGAAQVQDGNSAYNVVGTCAADAQSCSTTGLTFTLAANTAVKRAGKHTLVVRWKFESI